MQTTTISFQNMHTHGALLSNILKARRECFIVQENWDLPETDGMEFDQYDTPQSRWIAVHKEGRVLAGIRLTPTTAKCGMYSYMIRDAQLGLLQSIPVGILYDAAPVAEHIWESSRVFIAQDVPAADRGHIQKSLIGEMVHTAQCNGASEILALCPRAWKRWMRMLGYETEHVGPPLEIGGTVNQAIHMYLRPALH
ncbi:N-acyl-L-homoserine lactone synthetase [Planktotalea lamellibrachiae]|nr:acyl-homoserine-lactone synthase [Aliiroseovarius lamellibrachiae]MBT2129523.1 N-acyl-L-homoserine lactone synthetase [Aliiroseovarius lamellibrachiae]